MCFSQRNKRDLQRVTATSIIFCTSNFDYLNWNHSRKTLSKQSLEILTVFKMSFVKLIVTVVCLSSCITILSAKPTIDDYRECSSSDDCGDDECCVLSKSTCWVPSHLITKNMNFFCLDRSQSLLCPSMSSSRTSRRLLLFKRRTCQSNSVISFRGSLVFQQYFHHVLSLSRRVSL